MKRRAQAERGRSRRLRGVARLLAMAASVLLLGVGAAAVVATPAHAGDECTEIPGTDLVVCGTVINELDRTVTIAYNWCGEPDTGTACPPSSPGQQIVQLAPGTRTPVNVDWDAFRVDAGCTYTGTTRSVRALPVQWSFSGGSNGLWVKIDDSQDATIETSACGGLQPRATYRVKNVNSQLCLVARSAPGENPVVQSTCGDWADQRWYLDTAGGAGTFVRLRNYLSDKCIATRGYVESGAVATTCGDWADQQWIQENVGGVLRYRNVNSGLCLVARGTGESRAVQSICGDYNDQKWFRPRW